MFPLPSEQPPALSHLAKPIVPFRTFILKIGSRCNLNCTYCFIYNMADQRWREQPVLMSASVARQSAARIREHCNQHDVRRALIVLHGGEPLLGGADHLRSIVAILKEELTGPNIQLQIGMQSNGLLFTEEIGEIMLEAGVSMGISLDGPPEVNDRHRVDHRGQPTSARLEERLRLLGLPRFRPIFAGFLSVIDQHTDPGRVIDYLLSFDPPGFDFLLPHHNWVNPPPEKKIDPQATPFGDWLIRAFDHWLKLKMPVRIRFFDAIMYRLFGAPSRVESVGIGMVDFIVIETNGDFEAVDSLKSTFDGATHLGYNAFDHQLDDVATDHRVQARQLGAEGLCQRCQECSLANVCGGGYLPHRYSGGENFANPSVYCADLMKLIRHIRLRVGEELTRSGLRAASLSLIEASPSPNLSGNQAPSEPAFADQWGGDG
jgi:uncharacterized protein